MRLSLGIFAHNEEQQIGGTIESLAMQTLVKGEHTPVPSLSSIEIFCLANGCSDRTASVASECAHLLPRTVSYKVVDVPVPGKSRTWNAFVHEFSDRRADFLILMDADIIFGSEDVLEQLVSRLLSDTHAQVATDTPVKSTLMNSDDLSIVDRASLAASEQNSRVGVICGQLYCARAGALRSIWLPPELPVEDGFLAAMIATDGFTKPTDLSRISWVERAKHYFRTHRSVAGFVSHEARIIVGSTINSWLFEVLWKEGRKGHVGAFIETQNRTDSAWLSKLIQRKVRDAGKWLVPKHFLLWRLEALKCQPLGTKLRRAPIAFAATALNLVACIRANSILKRENAAAHW